MTKAGRRCSITTLSDLRNKETGTLVCEPLKRGCFFCEFHAVLFWATMQPPEDALDHQRSQRIFIMDLETTGLSPTRDFIVELGAVEIASGAVYCTVVQPPKLPDTIGVHGISPEELALGPKFPDAMCRFLHFVRLLTECTWSSGPEQKEVHSVGSSAELLSAQSSRTADVVIVAHNGCKFDFPFLCAECLRHGISLDTFAAWRFVDSLDLFRALNSILGDTTDFECGGCSKLQCLARQVSIDRLGPRSNEKVAHRALADVESLRSVLETAAARLDIPLKRLLAPFSSWMHVEATQAQLKILMQPARSSAVAAPTTPCKRVTASVALEESPVKKLRQ